MSLSIHQFSSQIIELMPQIMRGIFKRHIKHNDLLGQGKITIPQFMLLNILLTTRLKMHQIAQNLNASLPAATSLVNRLYSLKLVTREFDAKDRRIIYIKLTDKGKKIINDIKILRKKAIEKIFGQLSQKERQDYLAILKKLHIIISQQN